MKHVNLALYNMSHIPYIGDVIEKQKVTYKKKQENANTTEMVDLATVIDSVQCLCEKTAKIDIWNNIFLKGSRKFNTIS